MKLGEAILLAAGAGTLLAILMRDSVETLPIDDYADQESEDGCDPTAKPGTVLLRQFVLALAGEAQGAGENIVRACAQGGASGHKLGSAWDWFPRDRESADGLLEMLLGPDELGNEAALARRLGILYAIWRRRIWRAYPPRGWQEYTGANPHTDHVHFSLSQAGALAETSGYRMMQGGLV